MCGRKAVRRPLTEEIDPLMWPFKKGNPEFYQEYKVAADQN